MMSAVWVVVHRSSFRSSVGACPSPMTLVYTSVYLRNGRARTALITQRVATPTIGLMTTPTEGEDV